MNAEARMQRRVIFVVLGVAVLLPLVWAVAGTAWRNALRPSVVRDVVVRNVGEEAELVVLAGEPAGGPLSVVTQQRVAAGGEMKARLYEGGSTTEFEGRRFVFVVVGVGKDVVGGEVVMGKELDRRGLVVEVGK